MTGRAGTLAALSVLSTGFVLGVCALAPAGNHTDFAAAASSLWEASALQLSLDYARESLLRRQPSELVAALVAIVAASGLLYWAERPFYRRLPAPENEVNMSKIKARKRLGTLPPPYPTGWFRLLDSTELRRGETRAINALGQHLVAFRGADGQAAVLDAYCPHLGANLAEGGKVIGNCIECPFHGWRFDGATGKCVEIPGCETVPEVARTRTWLVKETNGMILIWHDLDGREPLWMPPEIEEINSGAFRWHGRADHEVTAHCQELPENGADVAHLNVVHPSYIYWLLNLLGFKHEWSAEWEAMEAPLDHMTRVRVCTTTTFLGIRFLSTRVEAKINQIGPGFVILRIELPIGRFVVVESVTPVKPAFQRIGHTIYSVRWLPRFVAKFVLHGLLVQFERDIPIWNQKTYVPTPLLVKADGPIGKFRRWYSKFYPKTAPAESLEW